MNLWILRSDLKPAADYIIAKNKTKLKVKYKHIFLIVAS